MRTKPCRPPIVPVSPLVATGPRGFDLGGANWRQSHRYRYGGGPPNSNAHCLAYSRVKSLHNEPPATRRAKARSTSKKGE